MPTNPTAILIMIQIHPFSLVLSVAAQRAQTPQQAAYVASWQETLAKLERSFAAPSSDH
jgi:hypothetical protein